MKLHIFNPEHDIALAYDQRHIMVPHAAQELRMNLGFLPALWADDGDCVLVDDIKFALKAASQFKKLSADVLFVGKKDLKSLPIDEVQTWGWDRRVKTELQESGIDSGLLPTDSTLSDIRCLSGREHTVEAIKYLRRDLEGVTCGEAFACRTIDEADECVASFPCSVVKAPWSSSGRGIRYLTREMDPTKHSWMKNTLAKQGYIMVEPYYNKVADFACEFYASSEGRVDYRGLSVFHTLNAQYTGNVISGEEDKRLKLARYVDTDLLDEIIRRIKDYMPMLLKGKYTGPFGIDMMAVADMPSGKLLLHPCVEINLRRTMGHVALALAGKHFEFASMMSISHDVNYQLRIDRIEGKFVNVIYR